MCNYQVFNFLTGLRGYTLQWFCFCNPNKRLQELVSWYEALWTLIVFRWTQLVAIISIHLIYTPESSYDIMRLTAKKCLRPLTSPLTRYSNIIKTKQHKKNNFDRNKKKLTMKWEGIGKKFWNLEGIESWKLRKEWKGIYGRNWKCSYSIPSFFPILLMPLPVSAQFLS